MEVDTADDGDVALDWLRASYAPGGGVAPADLVLMDMQMPRMDGLTATQRFRQWEREREGQQQRLPIYALSANVFDEKIAECTAAGMDGVCVCVCVCVSAFSVVLTRAGPCVCVCARRRISAQAAAAGCAARRDGGAQPGVSARERAAARGGDASSWHRCR
jgi:CheY-like chemotaxis protein